MEIPNSTPLGGDMDGMGDLDNAPMPPMGADDMGMGDPNAMGGEMPMDDPNAMGGQDPMGGEDPNAMNGSDDDELMNIVNGMSTEDKAAVIKYAKSMANDSEGTASQDPNMGGEMPMESKRNVKSIIDEVINDLLNDNEGTKRLEKKISKEYKGITMPFKSPMNR